MGTLSLEKPQKRFLEWIELEQTKKMFQKPFQIKPSTWQVSRNLENTWFSGFVDGEGCFTVNKILPKKKISPNLRLKKTRGKK